MTPRLRILSIGLALSLAYAIYDYVDRNNAKKSVVTKSKKPKKRARTAGVSATRAANLKKRFEKRIAKIGNKKTAKPKSNFTPCLLYTSPSPRDGLLSRMPSSA